MKKLILTALTITICLALFPQKKNVELDDFSVNGTFRAKGTGGIRSMNDGTHYTTLEDGKKIVKYAYETGQQVAVLVDLENMRNGSPIEKFADYQFSNDEAKVLVYTNRENIYRRSFKADYYVIDVQRREIEQLSKDGKQQQATFSPDGNNVAYVRDNNIFIKKLRFGTESPITTDGAKNSIINGLPDWVYEEEFNLSKAFEWSSDSEELAYIKFNETEVKDFTFTLFKASDPDNEDYSLYPEQYSFKYPKSRGDTYSCVIVKVGELFTKFISFPPLNVFVV